MHWSKFITLIVVFFLAFSIQAQEKIFKLAMPELQQGHPLIRYVELTYNEAFSRLGYQLSVHPHKTDIVGGLVNEGKYDGEAGRIRSYNEKYTNLILVKQPLLKLEISTFTLPHQPTINSWGALSKESLKVEYIKGTLIVENRLKEFAGQAHFSQSVSLEQSLQRLLKGEIDVFVGVNVLTMYFLENAGEEYRGVTRNAALEHKLFYPFLHIKHKNLAPRLEKVLGDMEAEGLLRQYKMDAFVLSQLKAM